MSASTEQLGLLGRLHAAFRIITKGGLGDAAAHIRRSKAAAFNGGPAEPYEQVVAVFRCVQFLAESVSYMPFCISTGDNRIIETGPIADLLDAPNPKMSIDEFWQQTVGWMLLSERGSCHWLFTRRIGGRPVEVLPVGDAQLRPVTEFRDRGVGEVVSWRYRPAGHRWDQAVSIETDEVWTVKVPGFDADRPFAGLSVLSVIRRAVNQVYKSDIANEASLDNGVEPGGVLILDGPATPEQKNDINSAMDERRGAANRRRHMVLQGNIRWEQIAASFTDMEFEKLKRYSRADVCAGFGLDPSAVGFPPEGGRFEYAQAAEDKAWISRVLPMAKSLAGQFDRGVLGHYEQDPSLRLDRSIREARPMRKMQRALALRATPHRPRRLFAWFDPSVVEAVKELYKSRVETASKMVRDLKETPEAAGDLMDLGLSGNDAQQLVWQTTTEMPYDAEVPVPGGDDPAGPDPTEQGGEEETIEATVPVRSTDDDAAKRATEKQLAQIYLAWRASWAGIEKALAGRVRRHFNDLRGVVIENIMAHADQLTAATGMLGMAELSWTEWDQDDAPREVTRSFQIGDLQRDLIGELLFDLIPANAGLVAKARPLIRAGVELGGSQAVKEHADAGVGTEPAPFNIEDPEVSASLRRREIAITGSNRTLRRRLAKELAEGIEAQETATQVADRVRREFNLAAGRSGTIARTEVGRAVEEGRAHGRRQSGTPLKSWLWSRKETGRPWHMDTEQQTLEHPVPNDEDFTVAQTGNTCPHPRATNDPEDDINCGCTTIARYPGDSIRAAIERYTRRGFLTHEQLVAQQQERTS